MQRLLAWLDHRLGIVTLARASLLDKHPPRGIGFLRTLGFAALVVLALQFLSGIALAFHYVPSAELAYDSIRAFEQDVPYGTLVRSLHHFGASAFVVCAALHMLRVYFTGAYKRPREFTWLTGIVLLTLVLGFGFTGYLLPWDQKAYFATKVGTEIAGKAPVVGEFVRTALNGGDEVGPPTLTRFYVIHVVLLPLGLLGVLLVHLALIQRHGVAPPGLPVDQAGAKGPPYFPHHVFKEVLVGMLVAGALFWLASRYRAPLEAVAEPSDTKYQPRPDWYFLGLFQLLKYFHGPWETVGTLWLPTLALAGAVLLPFVDRNPERRLARRPLAAALGLGFVAAVGVLTWLGWRDAPHNEAVLEYPLGLTPQERHGYMLVRRSNCTDCHQHVTKDGRKIGERQHDAPNLEKLDRSVDEVAAILEDPQEAIGSEDMPDYAHLSLEDRRAIGIYLKTLR
ncbi:MAG: cytochrome bc complex cytochrome b subunit [Planctomycetes bacterium]|nr:cytochrome bc complex cytochrome b subunit [Planctomycetota bacterium]